MSGLKNLTELTKLNLANNKLTSFQLNELFKDLKHKPNLTSLDISRNIIDVSCCADLTAFIKSTSSL